MTAPMQEIQEFDESATPQEQLLQWVRTADWQAVSEAGLPALLAQALAARRADHPERRLQVLALRVMRDGQETTRVGPARTPRSLRDLIALSVVVTSADSAGLHVDAYVLAARETRTRASAGRAPSRAASR
jgi:hypothetical protein